MDNLLSEFGQDEYEALLATRKRERELNAMNFITGDSCPVYEAGFHSYSVEQDGLKSKAYEEADAIVTFTVRLTPTAMHDVVFRYPIRDIERVCRQMSRPRKFTVRVMNASFGTEELRGMLRFVDMEIDEGLTVQLFYEHTPTPPGVIPPHPA